MVNKKLKYVGEMWFHVVWLQRAGRNKVKYSICAPFSVYQNKARNIVLKWKMGEHDRFSITFIELDRKTGKILRVRAYYKRMRKVPVIGTLYSLTVEENVEKFRLLEMAGTRALQEYYHIPVQTIKGDVLYV